MKKLPRIPSPASHYVDEFRHVLMPFVVFLSVLALTVHMWNKYVAPSNIIGEVEMVRAGVSVIEPGKIVNLNVDIFQRVTNGQVLGSVQIADEDTIKAQIAAAAADMETLRSRLQQDQEQTRMDYESLHLNWLQRKVDLASERVNLQYKVSEFERVSKLYQEKAVSESAYDLARNEKEVVQSKVTELGRLVEDTEQNLDRVKSLVSTNDDSPSSRAINAAIAAKQVELETISAPSVLRAPMTGTISAINRRTGEKVNRGETILVISANQSSRIVAYVRQPLNYRPKPGEELEVRARTFDRAMARAKILQVGSQLELVSTNMLPPGSVKAFEYGLPILVDAPAGLNLMPGELVDISVPLK